MYKKNNVIKILLDHFLSWIDPYYDCAIQIDMSKSENKTAIKDKQSTCTNLFCRTFFVVVKVMILVNVSILKALCSDPDGTYMHKKTFIQLIRKET